MRVASLLVALAAVHAAAAHGHPAAAGAEAHRGYACGSSHPATLADAPAPAVSPLEYHTPEVLDEYARRLTTAKSNKINQTYTALGSPFLPLSALNAAGMAQPIRIKPVWDVIARGEKYMCASETSRVIVKGSDGVEGYTNCSSRFMVVGPTGAERYALMQRRTAAAVAYWSSTLKIRPVQNPIVLSTDVTSRYNVSTSSVAGADLVLIMTARPSPFVPIAGYALCLQQDQYGRCTVGQFNWVPEQLSLTGQNDSQVITNEMHTALHEIVHLLGGMNPVANGDDALPFLDATGGRMPASAVYKTTIDPVYASRAPNKLVTKIITPKVLAVVREAFNCSSMDGMPLEDVDLGKGAHWEARLAGPELMSYGSGSGQVYVSDLTLAYLEDTNQYVANYSNAGKLTPDMADDFKAAETFFALGANGEMVTTPNASAAYPTPRPGALTWGRGAGCAFVNKPPRDWPTSGSAIAASHVCAAHQVSGCTPDNRMAAVCVVQPNYATESVRGSCGDINNLTSCVTNDAFLGGSSYGVPSWAQYFSSNADAAAAARVSAADRSRTGGFSNAMDYAPLMVGYWACNTPFAANDSTTSNDQEKGALSRLSSVFSADKVNMAKIGGQARCPSCRCLMSSLVELSVGINSQYPDYGLCYRTNCYKPNYLQVAIRGQVGARTYWYACPKEGGKVYIAGFLGSLKCPPAESFCANEAITGIRYPETSALLEAIFWGTLCGTLTLTALVCCCPCLRDPCLRGAKSCAGARAFEDEYDNEASVTAAAQAAKLPVVAKGLRSGGGSGRRLAESLKPPTGRLRKALFGLNGANLVLGIIFFGLGLYVLASLLVYSIGINILGFGVLIAATAWVGMVGARARAQAGPSCWLITYFFLDLLLLLILLYGLSFNMRDSYISSFVVRNWADLYDIIPSSYRAGATQADQVATATAKIKKDAMGLAALGAFMVIAYFAGLFIAGRLLKFKTLASMFVVVSSWGFAALGVIFAIVAFMMASGPVAAAGVTSVTSALAALGILLIVFGLLGAVGGIKKKLVAMYVYCTINLGLIGFVAALIAKCSNEDAVTTWVSGLNEDALAEVAARISMTIDKESLLDRLPNTLFMVRTVGGLIIALLLVLEAWAVLFIAAVRGKHEALLARMLPRGWSARAGGLFGGSAVGASGVMTPVVLGGGPAASVVNPVRGSTMVGGTTV